MVPEAEAWTQEQRRAVVGAVRDVLDGDSSARARDVVALAEEALEPWSRRSTPEDFAVLRDGPGSEIATVVLIVAACVREGGPSMEVVDRVGAYATAAGTDPRWIKVLRAAARGRGRRVTMLLAPRAPDGRRVLRAAFERRGVLAVLDVLRTMIGRSRPEPELGWWFKKLGLLPEGSVGRTFWARMTEHEIALPGEPGGLPEAAIHHDLVHTLTGYDTEPSGECQIGGFYAGMQYDGWPAWILAGLTTFELGLRVGPSFTVPTKGAFDVRRVLAAALRGHRARFRPLDDWDYRRLMPLSLDAARRELGLDAGSTLVRGAGGVLGGP